MSAFFIPQLGSMIYTMNGMRTQLHLLADAPGVFRGQSSHYNGDGFSDMRFDVQALPSDEFAAWIADTRKSGPTLDAGSYAAAGPAERGRGPFTFSAAAPMLFHQIVAQHLPPGPGPQVQEPQPALSPRTEN